MNLLLWTKNNWNKPTQAITALSAAILSYYNPLVKGISLGSSEAMLSLTRIYIVPVVWLIMSVPALLYAGKKHAMAWFRVGVIMFVLSLAFWIALAYFYQIWTCESELLRKNGAKKYVFVIGKTFTQSAIDNQKFIEEKMYGQKISDAKALEKLRATRPAELIEGAISNLNTSQDPALVWEQSEIDFRSLVFSILYITGVSITTISLITALQAWYCIRRPR